MCYLSTTGPETQPAAQQSKKTVDKLNETKQIIVKSERRKTPPLRVQQINPSITRIQECSTLNWQNLHG